MMELGKFVRGLSAWLALLLLLGSLAVLVSCGGDGGDGQSSGSESMTQGEDAEVDAYVNLEKTEYDKALKVYSIAGSVSDFMPDESQKGETLTDEMIIKNFRLKEDFGVEIKVTEAKDYLNMINDITKQISGRLDDYDLYAGQLHNFKNNALQNHCLNLNDLDYIDLYQPWWDENCRDALTMDGDKTYMMTGNISLPVMLGGSCMAFNKQLMEDLQKEEPYDLVYSGEWTLDKLYEQIDGVTNPNALDGAGRYGMTTFSLQGDYSFFYGAGETFVTFEDGTPVISYNSQKVIDIYNKIYNLMIKADSHYIYKSEEYDTISKEGIALEHVFVEGRALYIATYLGGVSAILTTMEDDYGVVPMPKYDTNQKDYLSFINGAYALFCIANTEKDPDFVAHMMEAIATYNYEYVADKVVDVVAKSKDIRDPESADMVDYVLSSRVYDFAYYTQLTLVSVVSKGLAEKKETIASQFSLAKKSSEKGLTSLLKTWNRVQEMENNKK